MRYIISTMRFVPNCTVEYADSLPMPHMTSRHRYKHCRNTARTDLILKAVSANCLVPLQLS
jgi:hypothetical protein